MNGYQELKDIHRLAQEAVLIYDAGEVPGRALIARIREIAGTFPKFGKDAPIQDRPQSQSTRMLDPGIHPHFPRE